jgi:hypothetical protein
MGLRKQASGNGTLQRISRRSFRTDFLDNKKGQRTGYATRYSENTITWCHWIGTTVQLRPELRFERPRGQKAYDNGRRHNQLIVASDLIFHF